MKSKAAYGLLVGAGLMAMAATAQAADAYTSSANPFNGFYMGVHAGYGWADSAIDYDGSYAASASSPDVDNGFDFGPIGSGPFAGDFSLSSKGALLGAHAGANFVSDSGLLLGMEVSGSWSGIAGEETFTDGDASIRAEQTISAIGLAQLKLGFANESAAIYALGGLALGQMNTSANLGAQECNPIDANDCSPFISLADINDKQTVAGWTIGAGADAMVSENVSIGVTYNYVHFEYDTSYDVNGDVLSFVSVLGEVNTDTSTSAHLVKASVSYHF